ncbi:hypothetical protein BC941DRAFT_56123 [Chlamydoabsidia padenii]|nr:hypothetical protein BC941DRAFT_56123 [Chlamydoabsidia padenii]
MKALATQRLMEQVSSLEKNVNKMNVSPKNGTKNPAETAKPEDLDVYTVIVDLTAFLDGLSNIKKWANQTLNIRRRVQTSILQVIVPLDVIGDLDYYKKGDSHMNLQARESIRYLDNLLKLADSTHSRDSHTRSFLRTQKVDETLMDWDQVSSFWIGDKNGLNDDTQDDDGDDDQTALTDSDDVDDASMSSDDDLFKTHGRRRGGRRLGHEEARGWASDTEDSEMDDDDDDDDYSTDGSDDDILDNDDDVEEDSPISPAVDVSYVDVPKKYRPTINCLLYFYQQQQQQQQQQQRTDQVDPLVLVTNDDDLAAWAGRFGDPSGKSVSIYTVREWDRILNTRSFDKPITQESRRRG